MSHSKLSHIWDLHPGLPTAINFSILEIQRRLWVVRALRDPPRLSVIYPGKSMVLAVPHL